MHDTGEVADRRAAVCVIGAGASGLAAIKNLREHGFAVDCYERETSVGGAWNWRHHRSPVYAGTRLVTSRARTEFPDFPMPDTWPDYPDHTRLLSYLERYCEHFGLAEHIWFGTEVVSVVPAGDGSWDVTTQSPGGGASHTQRYAAVVVANGHNWAPYLPEFPGADSYRGRLIHAAMCKDPAQLRGRRVLIVGGGNTGCDLAVAGAQHAAEVWHSTRRGHWYGPRYLAGRPVDQVQARLLRRRVPSPLRRWLYRRALRLVVGDLTRHGVAPPPHRPDLGHPVRNGQLAEYLHDGRIVAVPDIARFDAVGVTLADGRHIEPDLVVAATGYRPQFEFLAPELLDTDAEGRPDLHLHAFARQHPTLAVVGLLEPDAGLLPLAHWQSVAVARWLRLYATDRARAAQVQRRESTRAPRGWSGRRAGPAPRDWFAVESTRYLRALEDLLTRLEPA
ncbi:cation diffusion facilitator CzcD-associated flavoprotein CzcO [Krasilnikovia cinnamomea]|uniref:Cation diffusion facilitator CzcD-associated flavoprotein CzcO n=1 Tax=Krasilnikovia cinnamomea TaxID=349313 RepID=A0A4Q7ZPB4_9ACTN|nr:NAD(P)-binding domain-containing protein [Krasilnikovia cinnamomea]RZU52890.1 cation diffusion facilitator CzcD-associated flavoprotein CzcO [Krasilnikovia cinnamomea]